MSLLDDRFSILSRKNFNTEISIEKYFESYLRNNIICHHELLKNKDYNLNSMNMIFKNYLRENKNNFSKAIKKRLD